MLLEIKDLEAGYNKNKVLNGLSLSLDTGEIVAILGHNGAGKTTTLKTILGLIPSTRGKTIFKGKEMTRYRPAELVKQGMVLVLQEKSIFTDLTTEENLEAASHIIEDRSDIQKRMEMAHDLFPILKTRSKQRAGSLSGGEQRMLAIGMGLILQPALLMLDEPSVGLAPVMVQKVMDTVREINSRLDTAILLVEQNVREALTIASRAYIIKSGQVILERASSELLKMKNLWHLL
ncbi:MAG: ABC transporter ATP-binding protein [Pseudomonadota bacterium]